MTGHLPFEGEAVGDVLVKLCTAPLPVPSSIVPDVPPGFDAWMARALSREPAGRFQNAAELAMSLAAVCGLSTPLGANSGDGFSAVGMSYPSPHVSGQPTPFTATTPSPALTPAPAHATTGAPITQTPPPRERARAGTLIVAGLVALAVLGIGVAVLSKIIGKGESAAAATQTAETVAAAPPAPQPPAMAAAPAPMPEPTAAAPSASAKPAPIAAPAQPAPRPVVAHRPAPHKPSPPPSKGKPSAPTTGAPTSKPVSDMGF